MPGDTNDMSAAVPHIQCCSLLHEGTKQGVTGSSPCTNTLQTSDASLQIFESNS